MKKAGTVVNSPTPSTKLSYSIKKIRQPACPSSKPKRLSEFDSDEEHPRENEMNSRMQGLEMMMEKLINESISINRTIESIVSKPIPAMNADEPIIAKPSAANEGTIIEGRKVPKKEYATTSNSVVASFLANKITNTTENSFEKILMIRGSLGTTGLETILDGYRTEPVVSPTNPFGFIERRIINVEVTNELGEKSMKEIMLDDDDKFYFAHDQGRLYSAMMEVFDSTLHYLIEPEIKAKGGHKIYTKIMEHLNGRRAKDADKARKQFTSYVMDETITFKLEHYKFTQIINKLEHAQRKKIDDVDKMDFLYTRLVMDKRIGLKEVMIQAKLDNYDYDKTIEKLIEINMDTPDTLKNIRMKTINSTPKIRYCFAFNSNIECKFGSSCRYLHEKDPSQKSLHSPSKPPSAAPQKKFHKNTYENKTTIPSKDVTRENRSSYEPNVGPPSGVKSDKNPQGWSLKQISARKIIMKNLTTESIKSFSTHTDNENSITSSDTRSSDNFSSWGDTSSDVYHPQNNNENEITMKIMTINEINEELNTIQIHNVCDAMRTSKAGALMNRASTLGRIMIYQAEHHRRTVGGNLTTTNNLSNMPSLAQRKFARKNFVSIAIPETAGHPEGSNSKMRTFTGFGWNQDSVVSGNVREEIRSASGSFMELIYRVNEITMNAKITHAIPHRACSELHCGTFISDRYMTFRNNFKNVGTPGSYRSTVRDSREYYYILRRMKIEFDAENEEIIYHTSTFNVMLWGILYDFMAFCSQIYSMSATPRACKVQLQYEIGTRPVEDFAFKCVRQCMIQIVCDSISMSDQVNEIEMSDNEASVSTDSTQSPDTSDNDGESGDDDSSIESEEEVIEHHSKFNRMSIFPSSTSRTMSTRKMRRMNNNNNITTSVKEESN